MHAMRSPAYYSFLESMRLFAKLLLMSTRPKQPELFSNPIKRLQSIFFLSTCLYVVKVKLRTTVICKIEVLDVKLLISKIVTK